MCVGHAQEYYLYRAALVGFRNSCNHSSRGSWGSRPEIHFVGLVCKCVKPCTVEDGPITECIYDIRRVNTIKGSG